MNKWDYAATPVKQVEGVSYWTVNAPSIRTQIKFYKTIDTPFVKITPIYENEIEVGSLWQSKIGFANDGKSGGIQTKKTRLPAHWHDIGYWLIRNDYISKTYRIQIDVLYRRLNKKQGGFTRKMRDFWHWVLRKFGDKAAYKKKKVRTYYLRQ